MNNTPDVVLAARVLAKSEPSSEQHARAGQLGRAWAVDPRSGLHKPAERALSTKCKLGVEFGLPSASSNDTFDWSRSVTVSLFANIAESLGVVGVPARMLFPGTVLRDISSSTLLRDCRDP